MILGHRTVSLERARAPDGMRIHAIGDVHGRLDLLDDMLDLIDTGIAQDRPDDWRLVFLGDYVDRGPDSSGVIARLIERTADNRVVALAGNHDRGFLDFLDQPSGDGLFANFGGDRTAFSYGVVADFSTDALAAMSRDRLLAAMPEGHLRFLDGLAYSAAFGDYFFCHAGVRPEISLSRQTPHDLVWIREEFLMHEAPLEKVVVHGHTPTGQVALRRNRINVDTGAYFTGRLSCVVLEGAGKRVIEAIGPERIL